MLRVFGSRLVPQRTIVVFNKNYTSGETGKSNAPKPSPQNVGNVTGLSKKIVDIPEYPVGFRGAQKDSEYKCPEYFCYHVDSFADAFVELEKFRLPAPSNKAQKM